MLSAVFAECRLCWMLLCLVLFQPSLWVPATTILQVYGRYSAFNRVFLHFSVVFERDDGVVGAAVGRARRRAQGEGRGHAQDGPYPVFAQF